MATSVADQKKVANRDKITASNNLHTEYIIYSLDTAEQLRVT